MTSFRHKRCSHCRKTYEFQSSGEGCFGGSNDDRYCPTCKGAVDAALSKLPVLFECRYVSVSELPAYADVTRANIEEWEADLKRRREGGTLVAQRVWVGLIKFEAGDVQSDREVKATSGPHLGTRFRVSSWRIDPEYTIKVAVEWDITKQVMVGLWRD